METQHSHNCCEVAKIHLWIDIADRWCLSVGFANVKYCPWCGQHLTIGPTATAPDALETEVKRLQRELHDEQVRRNKWERMCKELGLVALEPAPDTLPCGHPREEANDDRA